MRRTIIATFIFLFLASQHAVSLDKKEELQALDFAEALHQTNKSAILPTYRNLLEVMGAAKTLESQSRSENGQVGTFKNTTLILNGTPTTIEEDPRTQANFSAVAKDQERIFGGISTRDAAHHDLFPDAVAIRTNQGALCSGTFIGNDSVVTAAHCFCEGNIPEWVIFGTSTDFGSQQTKIVAVNKAQSKPKMQCGSYQDGDVAVVRLSENVNTPPRKIAPTGLIDSAKSVRIVGFGKTEQGTSGVKLMVDVVITSHNCQGSGPRGTDAVVFGCYPNFELVASSPLLNRDSCNGDSGGGAFVQGQNGQYMLAALVSRGIKGPNVRPCGDGGIYPRVDGTQIRQWLGSNGVPSALQ